MAAQVTGLVSEAMRNRESFRIGVFFSRFWNPTASKLATRPWRASFGHDLHGYRRPVRPDQGVRPGHRTRFDEVPPRLCDLVAKLGGEIVACAFLVELTFLGGRERLAPRHVHALIEYDS